MIHRESKRHEDTLLDTPCEKWRTRQAVVFDWFDGPREGVCALIRPQCEFYFEQYSGRGIEDDLDDRLFLISELRMGTVDRIVNALTELGQPSNSVWTPIWKFESDASRQRAEKVIDSALKKRRATSLIVRTGDMRAFSDCLSVQHDIKKFLTWFEFKGSSIRRDLAAI